MKSQKVVNQRDVNLFQDAAQPAASSSGAPLQMCQSNYEGQQATSYYQTETSFQSAEMAAMTHAQEAKAWKESQEQKLHEF